MASIFAPARSAGPAFPGEPPGELPALKNWSATTGYTLPFGQGYSVNTVQMASIFATIANDGVRVPPRLVRARVTPGGHVQPVPAPKGKRVVSAKTATTVRLMMETVLGDDGTAPAARIPGYRVGGKTGTAQRLKASRGGYSGF